MCLQPPPPVVDFGPSSVSRCLPVTPLLCSVAVSGRHGLSLSTFASQVKQIMEEAVTRKFVHADSSHIISFCGNFICPCFTRFRPSWVDVSGGHRCQRGNMRGSGSTARSAPGSFFIINLGCVVFQTRLAVSKHFKNNKAYSWNGCV